ncbi:MAG: hypothetical protein JNM88_20555 [Chitinophagaceae bacterium]|nr:hypothetical protein [Chitinophagaceae bacterium]
MEQDQNQSLFAMNLDAQNSYTLRSTASWAKVLGVASIIMGVLFIILGIMVQQAMNQYGYYDRGGFSAASIGNAGLAIYVILGLIFGISGMFALNAGNKITTGLKSNNMETLNSGFANARNFFALWAILVIIFLLLMFIGLMGRM